MAIERMLCVDDEQMWRDILKGHFQQELTPNVDVAGDYDSAMQMIRQNKYDLIMLDGLRGDCFKVYRDIQTIPHGDLIIFSGCDDTREEAEKRKIPFYHKLSSVSNLDRIVEKYKSPVYDETDDRDQT